MTTRPLTGLANVLRALVFFAIHLTIHVWTIILPTFCWRCVGLAFEVSSACCRLFNKPLADQVAVFGRWCRSGYVTSPSVPSASLSFNGNVEEEPCASSASTTSALSTSSSRALLRSITIPFALRDKDSPQHAGEAIFMSRFPRKAQRLFGFVVSKISFSPSSRQVIVLQEEEEHQSNIRHQSESLLETNVETVQKLPSSPARKLAVPDAWRNRTDHELLHHGHNEENLLARHNSSSTTFMMARGEEGKKEDEAAAPALFSTDEEVTQLNEECNKRDNSAPVDEQPSPSRSSVHSLPPFFTLRCRSNKKGNHRSTSGGGGGMLSATKYLPCSRSESSTASPNHWSRVAAMSAAAAMMYSNANDTSGTFTASPTPLSDDQSEQNEATHQEEVDGAKKNNHVTDNNTNDSNAQNSNNSALNTPRTVSRHRIAELTAELQRRRRSDSDAIGPIGDDVNVKKDALRSASTAPQDTAAYDPVGAHILVGTEQAWMGVRPLTCAPWYNRHVSSIFAFNRPHVPGLIIRREVVPAHRDGNELALDWILPSDNSHLLANFDADPPNSKSRLLKEILQRLHLSATHDTLLHPLSVNDETFPSNVAIRGVVLIVPGLTSCSRDGYIQHFATQCIRRNFAAVVLNARGLGGHNLTVPQTFSASFTCDLRTILRYHLTKERLMRRFSFMSSSPFVALVGFSLGANMAGVYLAEEGDDLTTKTCVRAATLVCAPFDFFHGFTQFYTNPITNYIYQPELLAGIRRYITAQDAAVSRGIEEGSFKPEWRSSAFTAKSFKEFDHKCVAPHHGYTGSDEYYTKSQCLQYLHRVRCPTICLSTNDDPVVGDSLPRKRWLDVLMDNYHINYVEVPFGGHIGFLGSPLQELAGRPNWMEELIVGALEHHSSAAA